MPGERSACESYPAQFIATSCRLRCCRASGSGSKGRRRSCAGCIELLLQEVEGNRRYEVEIKFGKTDFEHIMLTLEYWDHERSDTPSTITSP